VLVDARRELLGFFASPIPALALLWSPLLAADWSAWITVSLASVPFGWGVLAFFGLPLHILAIHRGWTKLWQYLVGGAMMGLGGLALLLPAGVFVGLTLTMLLPTAGFASETSAYVAIAAAFGIVGALTSGSFWWIAHIRERAHARPA
jgi:hypothetical protein